MGLLQALASRNGIARTAYAIWMISQFVFLQLQALGALKIADNCKHVRKALKYRGHLRCLLVVRQLELCGEGGSQCQCSSYARNTAEPSETVE